MVPEVITMADDQGKEIEQIVQMEMKARQSRVEGFQAMNKARQEGFQMANESSQKSQEVRQGTAFKRSAADGADFSKETKANLGQ